MNSDHHWGSHTGLLIMNLRCTSTNRCINDVQTIIAQENSLVARSALDSNKFAWSSNIVYPPKGFSGQNFEQLNKYKTCFEFALGDVALFRTRSTMRLFLAIVKSQGFSSYHFGPFL